MSLTLGPSRKVVGIDTGDLRAELRLVAQFGPRREVNELKNLEEPNVFELIHHELAHISGRGPEFSSPP